MLRFFLISLFLLATSVIVAATDPPGTKPKPVEPFVPLKKKDKPKSAAPEPGPKRERPSPVMPKDNKDKALVPVQDLKEAITRITKNMRYAEERLAKKDAGDGTRQMQRDILKGLDSLIQQNQQRQQQDQQQNDPQQNRQPNQQDKNSPSSRRQPMPGQKRRSQQPMSGQAQPQPQPGRAGASKPELAKKKLGRDDMNKIADVYKDIWGHLPETLRKEMDAYAREEFMAKYSDLLKQYYATIAAKGRRKGG